MMDVSGHIHKGIWNLVWAISLMCFLFFQACTEDPLLDEKKSEISIRFETGPLAGQTFLTNTGQIQDEDLRYYPTKNATRVFCQPLIEEDSNRLNSSSSINWAWEGVPSTGQQGAIFFNDPSEAVAGDIDLSFTNGDYINASIPKNASIQIESYGLPGEHVTGFINFSAFTDYKYQGIKGQQVVSVLVEFKIVRSPDQM
jgi:hypothetical protein